MPLIYHEELGQKSVHEEQVAVCELAGWVRVEAPKNQSAEEAAKAEKDRIDAEAEVQRIYDAEEAARKEAESKVDIAAQKEHKQQNTGKNS